MDFDYTPEQERLRKDYRARLEAVMTPERRASVATPTEGGAAVADCRRALGEAGLLGVAWPTEYGGGGLTALEQYIFGEEARRVNAPLPMITLNTVGPTLIQFGTDEQKEKFLPAILKGTVDFAIGYSEPGAGSDLASLRTSAVRDGDDFVINGSKMFTSGAEFADYIWLAARTDPEAKKHKGITLFIVPTDAEGFSWKPLHTMPGVSTYYTFYDDVRVPASSIVLGENEGLEAGHQSAQPGARRARQSRRTRATLPQDPEVGQGHPARWRIGHRQTVGAAGSGAGRSAGGRL